MKFEEELKRIYCNIVTQVKNEHIDGGKTLEEYEEENKAELRAAKDAELERHTSKMRDTYDKRIEALEKRIEMDTWDDTNSMNVLKEAEHRGYLRGIDEKGR